MQTQNQRVASVVAFARYFSRPNCPQCGGDQFAPERSEFVSDALIHHTWACDSCGNEFRTKVELILEAA